MRHLLPVLFTILIIQANGQSFVNYKDTINHFAIKIPAAWNYGVPKQPPEIKLAAYRIPVGKSDTVRFSLNINIFNMPIKDRDKAFADILLSLSDAEDFKIIDKGDTTINGIKFKWLIETHKYKVQFHNYDLIALRDGKAFILTMVAFSNYFDSIKPLFDQIANSFIIQ